MTSSQSRLVSVSSSTASAGSSRTSRRRRLQQRNRLMRQRHAETLSLKSTTLGILLHIVTTSPRRGKSASLLFPRTRRWQSPHPACYSDVLPGVPPDRPLPEPPDAYSFPPLSSC